MHAPIHRISLSRCNSLKNLLIQENFVLRVRTRLIRLSKDNIDKNRLRHQDLLDHEYELIPKILEYGSASILKNEPNRLVFVWTNPVSDVHYTVAIKPVSVSLCASLNRLSPIKLLATSRLTIEAGGNIFTVILSQPQSTRCIRQRCFMRTNGQRFMKRVCHMGGAHTSPVTVPNQRLEPGVGSPKPIDRQTLYR